MTVYFTFQEKANGSGPIKPLTLEQCPSIEVAQRELKSRALRQTGHVWHQGNPGPLTDFPGSDETALMLVWHRKAADPAPRGNENPDYLWGLTERGAVTVITRYNDIERGTST